MRWITRALAAFGAVVAAWMAWVYMTVTAERKDQR